MEVEKKQYKSEFSRSWLMLMQPIYGMVLKMVSYKMVIQYAERVQMESWRYVVAE